MMIRCIANLAFIILFAATLLVCSSCEKQPSYSKIPVDYEIEDVRNLPQDISAYTSFYPENSLDKTCQSSFLSDFNRKYYAPWTSSKSISNISDSVATMKEYVQRKWYGENKRKVPRNVLDGLLVNCDLEHLPSMKRLAIATAATDMRVLPTTKPFFVNADDFPFDALQNTALKLNEPIKILHASRDGLWVFVETSGTNGWVRSRDVGYIDKKLTKKWMKKEQIVIVKDFTLIHDKNGFVAQKAKIGTICPVDGESGGAYEISVAINAGMHNVRVVKAKVPRDSARRFPLEFNRESIALIGNELINEPYGWGEMFQNRDCSTMLRDFFLPFGIWLPRGSLNQINSGRSISLNGLGSKEKERLIKEKGIPFLTLVYLKGHIMLYVGSLNGKALIFHDIWGVSVSNGRGDEYKQVIGKSIVSTLNPGSELHLAGDTLPERVTSMLVLSDGCAGQKRLQPIQKSNGQK
jgi:hypothetical protein